MMRCSLNIRLINIFSRDKIVPRQLWTLWSRFVMTSVRPLVSFVEKLISHFSRNEQWSRAQIIKLYWLNFWVVDA